MSSSDHQTVTSQADLKRSQFGLGSDEFFDLLNRSPFELPILVEQCLGDTEFALSLLSEFVTILADRLEKMVQAAQAGDLSSLKTIAHGLKGASAYAAAPELSRVCSLLEEAAIQNSPIQVRPRLQDVCNEIDRCIQAFPKACRKLQTGNETE